MNQENEPLIKKNQDEAIQIISDIQLTEPKDEKNRRVEEKLAVGEEMANLRHELEKILTKNLPLVPFSPSNNTYFSEIESLQYEKFLAGLKQKISLKPTKIFMKDLLVDSINTIFQETEKFLQEPLVTRVPPLEITDTKTTIRDMTLFPDQRRLLVCLENGEIFLYDIAKTLPLQKANTSSQIFVSVLHPQGNCFALGTNQGCVLIYDSDLNLLSETRISQVNKIAIKAITFSIEGRFFFVGSDLEQLKSFEFKENNLVFSSDILEHEDGVLSIACSPLAKIYASGGYCGDIKIFTFDEEQANTKILRTLNIHKTVVRSLSFSKDGEFLLTGSFDKTAKLVNSHTGKLLKEYKGHSECINTAVLSNDNKFVLTGSSDNTAKLFDKETGDIIYEFLNQKPDPDSYPDDKGFDIRVVHFMEDSSKLIMAGEEAKVKIINIEKGQRIRGYAKHIGGSRINCIDAFPSLSIMLTGGEDGKVKLFDLRTGFELRNYEGGNSAINVVKFSPDSSIVLSGGEDSVLRVFQTNSGNLVRNFYDNNNTIQSIIFARGRPEFATGGDDKIVNVYSCLTYERIVTKEIKPKPDEIDDKEIIIEGFKTDEIKKNGIRVRCMFYSPDDNWIVVGGYTNEIGGTCLTKVVFMQRSSAKLSCIQYGKGIINAMEYIANKYLVGVIEDDETGNTDWIFINTIENFNINMENLPVKKIELNFDILSLFSDEKYLYCLSLTKEINNEIDSSRQINCYEIKDDGNLEQMSILHSNTSKYEYKITGNIIIYNDFIFTGTAEGKPLILSKANNSDGNYRDIPLLYDIKNFEVNESSMIATLNEKNDLRILNSLSGNSWLIPKAPTNAIYTCLKFSNSDSMLYVGLDIGGLQIYDIERNVWSNPKIKLTENMNAENSPVILIENILYENFLYVFIAFKNNCIACLRKTNSELEYQKLQRRLNYHEDDILLLSPKVDDQITKDVSPVSLLILLRNGSLIELQIKTNWIGSTIFFEQSNVLSRLKEPLTCARNSKNLSKIIMGGQDKLVRIFDLKTKGETIFRGHDENIRCVDFLSDLKYAVSASEDNVIKVFEIESGNVIFEHRLDCNIICMNIAYSLDSIIIGTENGMQIIERVLNSRGKIEKFKATVEKAKNNNINLIEALDSDVFDMLPININLSLLHLNLAFSSEQNEIELLKKISEFLSSKNKVDSKRRKLLCDCIFKESFNTSPWEIWIQRSKNQKSTDKKQMIYENLINILLCPDMSLIEKMKSKPEFIATVASLCPNKLPAVLDAFWQPSETITVISHRMTWSMQLKYFWDMLSGIIDVFGSKQVKLNFMTLPIVLHSKTPDPCSRVLERIYNLKYEAYNERDGDKMFITSFVKISKIKLNEIINIEHYRAPVKDSVFLPELFSNFQPDDPLFKSEYLAIVVDYLWRLKACIGYTYYRRVFIFIIFQIIICLNCLYVIPERQNRKDTDHKSFENVGLVLDLVILTFIGVGFIIRNINIIKIYRMYGKQNFRFSTVFSLWKLLDLVICILGFAVFGLDIYWRFLNENEDDSLIVFTKCLLALFFATTWFKLIEFARGFSSTSALVRLLGKVTYDMSSYLFVILFLVVGLAFTSFILQSSYKVNNLWHYFKISYGILIGSSDSFRDAEQALNKELYFILLFFASVYLVIIMLNLLIAIVNDSFGKVLAKEKQNEIYEKLNIIYNYIYELDAKEKEILNKALENDYLFQLNAVNDEQKEEEDQINKLNKLEEALSDQENAVQNCNQNINAVSAQLNQIQNMLKEVLQNKENICLGSKDV